MTSTIRKIGKFYSSIIMKNVVLFLAFGLMSVFFAETGWLPERRLYSIAVMIYQFLIPVMIGFTAGKKAGDEIGGAAGALASVGFVMDENISAIMGAMLISPAAGYVAGKAYDIIREKVWAGFEMLVKNLVVAVIGSGMAVFSWYFLVPVINAVTSGLNEFVDYLLNKQMLPFIGILVEPAKVFFLNNGLNHGIFIPIGMEQMQQTGKSILFLIETNPGPGLGILAACYLKKRQERRNFTSGMIIHFLGGIHEVYFPYVLMNLKLLLAVIAGGITGIFIFSITGAGLAGPVSPGSIFTILLMSGKNSLAGILLGVFLSALVTAVTALPLMKREDKAEEDIEKSSMTSHKKIEKVYFVCDAGVGSSTMGAALLRRKFRETGIEGVVVLPSSVDEIPEDGDLLICQNNFVNMLKENYKVEIYGVNELVNIEEYIPLIERLKGGQES